MLKLTSELLVVNPDFYTLWNIRREVFHAQCQKTDSKETRYTIGLGELRLLERCIKVNPKSYYSWYHRIYILEHFCDAVELEKELKLCDQFLNIDERNCKNKHGGMTDHGDVAFLLKVFDLFWFIHSCVHIN
jgi:geranylgeranyl transferase type-2 subunit alpha